MVTIWGESLRYANLKVSDFVSLIGVYRFAFAFKASKIYQALVGSKFYNPTVRFAIAFLAKYKFRFSIFKVHAKESPALFLMR